MNRVNLIGNVGKDPECRRLENGTLVATFSVATTEGYKDASGEWQNQTEWHNVVVWRNVAEEVEKTIKKGAGLFIEGKLTHRRYTDKNGIERYATEIVAATVKLLLPKQKDNSAFPTVANEPPAHYSTDKPTQLPPTVSFDSAYVAPLPNEIPPQNLDIDGLPF